MTQAPKRTSARTRRTDDSKPTLNGNGLRDEQNLVGDRDDRDERDNHYDRDERSERDNRNERDERSERDDRSERDNRNERDDRNERDSREPSGVQRAAEQVTDRVRAATSDSGNAFGSTPDMSKAVTAWFDMAGDMLKLQQQFFTSLLGAGNTNTRTTTKV